MFRSLVILGVALIVCATSTLYGTATKSGSGDLWMVKIDPKSGKLTYLIENPNTAGNFQIMGLSTFDHTSNTFYYPNATTNPYVVVTSVANSTAKNLPPIDLSSVASVPARIQLDETNDLLYVLAAPSSGNNTVALEAISLSGGAATTLLNISETNQQAVDPFLATAIDIERGLWFLAYEDQDNKQKLIQVEMKLPHSYRVVPLDSCGTYWAQSLFYSHSFKRLLGVAIDLASVPGNISFAIVDIEPTSGRCTTTRLDLPGNFEVLSPSTFDQKKRTLYFVAQDPQTVNQIGTYDFTTKSLTVVNLTGDVYHLEVSY